VAHLWAEGIRPNRDELEAGYAAAMRTLRSNGFIVDYLELIRFQPHELEALWAGPDLR
jgi:hypothetical protein